MRRSPRNIHFWIIGSGNKMVTVPTSWLVGFGLVLNRDPSEPIFWTKASRRERQGFATSTPHFVGTQLERTTPSRKCGFALTLSYFPGASS